MFFGRYDCTIDAKGRLNFPAKFRDGMGDSFVVMEWLDQCLFALPMSEVERISERMGADELMDSWEITGDLFSTACEVTLDKQGRILLPASLRQYAGLGKTVAVIGNRNHAEIWDAARWDARRAAVTNEQRAARLRELCARFADFVPLPGAVVPADSMLREFIGPKDANDSQE